MHVEGRGRRLLGTQILDVTIRPAERRLEDAMKRTIAIALALAAPRLRGPWS
jgi:hypothetical protein